MKSTLLHVCIAGIALAVFAAPGLAQTPPRPLDFQYEFPQFSVPPIPLLPPLPPVEMHFAFPGQARTAVTVDPQTSFQQEVFRSLLRIAPDRALDLAAERLKADPADPADPVVLANLPQIANSTSTKALPLLVSIAKTSTNQDARRSAMSAIARTRSDKDGLTLLEEIYNGSADNAEMRRAVVTSIGRMSDPRTVTVLARIARTDPDMSIRRLAVQYLGNRNEAEAHKVLEELLKGEKRGQ